MSFEELPLGDDEFESYEEDEIVGLISGHELAIRRNKDNPKKIEHLLLLGGTREVIGSCDITIGEIAVEIDFLNINEKFRNNSLGTQLYNASLANILKSNSRINMVYAVFVNPYAVRLAANNVPEGWVPHFMKTDVEPDESDVISLEEAKRIQLKENENLTDFGVHFIMLSEPEG